MRWESLAKIMSNIKEGVNVVIDRYAFSGVAFSAAKEGMTLDWCKKCDVGLPKPDLVLLFDLTPEEVRKRGQWGEERYEKESVQRIVRENYNKLMDSSWKVIDANKTIDDLQEEVKAEVIKTIDIAKDEKLKTLWTE
ncbi:Thymidylate kinase-like [Homarus americanus]|uniref:dTMP kinase n=1 Tax=Homarus americanus TaxID=6706 RepID=A0A8J5K409_HOMAM|nr:Thymidylate kinase-like [Homarus americanus]